MNGAEAVTSGFKQHFILEGHIRSDNSGVQPSSLAKAASVLGAEDPVQKLEFLDPEIVIPGHGEPTTIDVVTKETRGYLVFLRNAVIEILEQGGGLDDAYNIDQSQWSYLDTFEELAGKNAGRVYQDLEFDYF